MQKIEMIEVMDSLIVVVVAAIVLAQLEFFRFENIPSS
jgi:hypothetical protein